MIKVFLRTALKTIFIIFTILFVNISHPQLALSDITIGDTVFNNDDIENYNLTINFIQSLSNENNAAFFEGLSHRMEFKESVIHTIIGLGSSLDDLLNNAEEFVENTSFSSILEFAHIATTFAELLKSGEDDRRLVELFAMMDLLIEATELMSNEFHYFAQIMHLYGKIFGHDINNILDRIDEMDNAYKLVSLLDLEEYGSIGGVEPVKHPTYFPQDWGDESPKFYTAEVKGSKDQSGSVLIYYNIFKNNGYRPVSLDPRFSSLPPELDYYKNAQYILLVYVSNIVEFNKEVSWRTLWQSHWNVDGILFLVDTGLDFKFLKDSLINIYLLEKSQLYLLCL
jgi:hypothetical protein